MPPAYTQRCVPIPRMLLLAAVTHLFLDPGLDVSTDFVRR